MNHMLSTLALLSLLGAGGAQAQGDDATHFKLSAGHYRYDWGSGSDLNLRWRDEGRSAWVGVYRDAQFGQQWRLGMDSALDLADGVQLQSSLQAAGQGFMGGSANLQLGTSWYALLGWGRTNLRPYFNLNFDPNDAVTLGLGWQGEHGQNLALTLIADDRLHTGQRHWHLGGRWPLGGDQRLTLDLLHKRGQGDGGWVSAWGWTLGYDWPRYFLRLARDPKQNFSVDDATRLSLGLRF